MQALGAALARATPAGSRIHLSGELAAGKTTLARGFLRALGVEGTVKSPTFTIVESYAPGGREVHHFDLYRLNRASELDELGFEDYLGPDAICLIEWPERGADALEPPDLLVRITVSGPERRSVRLLAATPRGTDLLRALGDTIEISN